MEDETAQKRQAPRKVSLLPRSTWLTTTSMPASSQRPMPAGTERQFVGSLIDSYTFKPNIFVKKTISMLLLGMLTSSGFLLPSRGRQSLEA